MKTCEIKPQCQEKKNYQCQFSNRFKSFYDTNLLVFTLIMYWNNSSFPWSFQCHHYRNFFYQFMFLDAHWFEGKKLSSRYMLHKHQVVNWLVVLITKTVCHHYFSYLWLAWLVWNVLISTRQLSNTDNYLWELDDI